MRRFFKASRNYIFVVPVAVAMSDDGGCSSVKPGPLTEEQVRSVVVDNTFTNVDSQAFAFVDEDGEIRADIEADDGIKQDKGTWTVDDAGQFCVTWQVTIHGKNNCAQFVALEEKGKFSWGGHTYTREKGNPKKL